MQFLRQFFNFYIFSNIHVAIGTFCFVKITLVSQDIYKNDVAFFVFFSTIVSYNFIRFQNIYKTKNWITNWFEKQKKVLFFVSVISGVGLLFFLFRLNLKAVIILIPFIILTFFYGVQLPNTSVSLRRIPGLKTFLIAFCYAGITVVFPLVQNSIEIEVSTGLLFFQRLFFVLLITIPFDIRDVKFDSYKLKTIPQYFGIRLAKVAGVLLVILIILIELVFLDHRDKQQTILFIITGFALILLLFSKKEQSKYYSSFWVEALPIVWCLLLGLF